MPERGSMMALHSVIIGFIIYAIMSVMGVDEKVAENRSVMIAGFAVVYMVLFGHSMPNMGTAKENTGLNEYY